MDATKPIEQLMTRDPLAWCAPHDSLNDAANLMWDQDCGAIPVVEDGRVVAMLSDQDICMAAYLQSRRLTELAVSSAMSQCVHSCGLGDSVEDVCQLMGVHQVRRLPVTDGEGRLVGVVSLSDLIGGANSGQAIRLLETLKKISERRLPSEVPEQ
tara:strand:- start:68 stop:532 length:465 start_codon:yes stop_codon:yes gene_type:complete